MYRGKLSLVSTQGRLSDLQICTSGGNEDASSMAASDTYTSSGYVVLVIEIEVPQLPQNPLSTPGEER
jgi:hypothetical protein